MEYNEAGHQLFINFKKAYDSVRREVLYNILVEFGIPMKLVVLIKMRLTETYVQQSPCRQEFVRHVSYEECFETRRCSIAIAFQLCFRVRH